MGIALTFISILVAFIAIFVAINVAYNFYSIHDFQKRLGNMELTFQKRVSVIEDSVNAKVEEINREVRLFREVNKVYVNIIYQVHNANAKFSFNDRHYFEAIVHELRNIYHITLHKQDFSLYEFNQYIGAKYWFIAQDTLKYESDDYLNSTDDSVRNKTLELRNEIIALCSKIEQHPNAIDVEEKLRLIRRVIPTLIDDLYYHKPIHPYGGDWDKIRVLAK